MTINDVKIRLLQSRFFKDSFWALFGNVINKGFSLISAIVIARWLGADIYGEYGTIKNTLVYVAVFSTFGLGLTATRFVAKNKDASKEKIKAIVNASTLITLCFSTFMAACFFMFADSITSFLEFPEVENIVRITAVTIVFNAVLTNQIGVLSGFGLFKEIAKINVLVGVANFFLSIVLTYFYGLSGAVVALMLSNILNCLLNVFVVRSNLRVYPKSNIPLSAVVKEMVCFSFPVALQESLCSVAYWAGTIVLVKMAGYYQVGLYSAASQWVAVVLFIPSFLQNVMLSYLSTETNEESHNSMLKKMVMINLTATSIPFFVILIFSNYIASFYGDNYKGLNWVLVSAIGTTVFICLIQVYIQEYISLGKTWQLFFIRLARDSVSLLISYFLISTIQKNGALLHNISYCISSLLCLFLLIIIHARIKSKK